MVFLHAFGMKENCLTIIFIKKIAIEFYELVKVNLPIVHNKLLLFYKAGIPFLDCRFFAVLVVISRS